MTTKHEGKCTGSCGELIPEEIAKSGGSFTSSARTAIHHPNGTCHYINKDFHCPNCHTEVTGAGVREEWYNNKFASPIANIVSKMLDNPGPHGIYYTSECYEALNNLITSELSRLHSRIVEEVEKNKHKCEIKGHTHHKPEKWFYNIAMDDVKVIINQAFKEL